MRNWLASITKPITGNTTRNRADRPHRITSAPGVAAATSRERAHLDRLSSCFPVPAGTRLTIEGANRREWGMLLDGTATVYVGGQAVGTLRPGDDFGAAGVLASPDSPLAVQPTTIVTDSDQWVATMTPIEVRSLVSGCPRVARMLGLGRPPHTAGAAPATGRPGDEVGGLVSPSTV